MTTYDAESPFDQLVAPGAYLTGIVTASVVGQLITPSTVKPAKNDRSRANQLTGEVSE
jgi:hypothetical protein